MNDLPVFLVIYFSTLPFFFMTSIYSLEYYTAKFGLTQEDRHKFFKHLPSVLRIIYSDRDGWANLYILRKHDKSLEAYLNESSENRAWKHRMLYAFIPGLLIFALIVGLIRSAGENDTYDVVFYSCLIISIGVSLWYAWNFGRYRVNKDQI